MRRGTGESRFGLDALGHDPVGRFAVQDAPAAGVVGRIEASQGLFASAVRADGDAEHLGADTTAEALAHAVDLGRVWRYSAPGSAQPLAKAGVKQPPSSVGVCVGTVGLLLAGTDRGRSPGQTMAPTRPSHAGHRFPVEIIGCAVWLYSRFPFSPRCRPRGVGVTHGTVRQWAPKSGEAFADRIRRRLPRAGDGWHLDEVAVKVAGVRLRRAVGQDGIVLDVLVQSRRDKAAAERLPREPLKRRCRPPHVPVADKLASYKAAKDEAMPSVERRGHKGTSNRAGNSRRPATCGVSSPPTTGSASFSAPRRNRSAARTRTSWTWTETAGIAAAA